jgi:hypothetical protein
MGPHNRLLYLKRLTTRLAALHCLKSLKVQIQ